MPRKLLLAILAAGAGCAGLAAPASAQSPGEEKMNMVIVYGDDACPQSQNGEITVCARKSESERYRIPEGLRGSASPENRSWTDRVLSYERVGASGTQSCTPTGAGGWTGCAARFIQDAYAEKKESADVHFSDMLAKEREKRAAAVDADAAATQARVEQAEKEYDARKRAEAEAAEGGRPAPAAVPAAAPAPAAAPTATPTGAAATAPVAQSKPGRPARKAKGRKEAAAPPAE